MLEEDAWFVGISTLVELIRWRGGPELVPAEVRGTVLNGTYLTDECILKQVREQMFVASMKIKHYTGKPAGDSLALPGQRLKNSGVLFLSWFLRVVHGVSLIVFAIKHSKILDSKILETLRELLHKVFQFLRLE
jgi:hypothetical protein